MHSGHRHSGHRHARHRHTRCRHGRRELMHLICIPSLRRASGANRCRVSWHRGWSASTFDALHEFCIFIISFGRRRRRRFRRRRGLSDLLKERIDLRIEFLILSAGSLQRAIRSDVTMITADRALHIGWIPTHSRLRLLPGSISQRAVNLCQFPQLRSLMFIPSFINRDEQLPHQMFRLQQRFLIVRCDQHMQLILVGIHSAFAFLLRTFSTNHNPRACFAFHSLLRVATWADDQTDEIVIGIILIRNVELLRSLRNRRVIICGGLVSLLVKCNE